MKFTILSLIPVLLYTGVSLAESWSFTAVADPMENGAPWITTLKEIKNQTVNPAPQFSPSKFITISGDFLPVKDRFNDHKTVFSDVSTRPAFLPVPGNHDLENYGKSYYYLCDSILPTIPGVKRRDNHSNYHYDYRNVRVIAINQYNNYGNELSSTKYGSINAAGKAWVDSLLKATHDSMHVFLFFHEPAFPRIQHIGDSFNDYPEERNAFWNMLIGHNKKVRAVFVGHTHKYSRLRVKNPASADANDPQKYPDDAGGIYEVNVAATGNGREITIVNVQIEGRRVRFRAIQTSSNTTSDFRIIDQWVIDEGAVSALPQLTIEQDKNRSAIHVPLKNDRFDIQGRILRSGKALPEIKPKASGISRGPFQRTISTDESAR